VSVVISAGNEEATVGTIVTAIRTALVQTVPLADETIVADFRSGNETADAARAVGAFVVSQDDIIPGLSSMHGKGGAMRAGPATASSDIVAFVAADVDPFDPRFVSGLLGPLPTDPSMSFVKGYYHRLLGPEATTSGGGHDTRLMARPLRNLFWSDLTVSVQPLAGESADRREVLDRVSFVSGYGVEIAMLVDLLEPVDARTATRTTRRLAGWPHRSSSPSGRGSHGRGERRQYAAAERAYPIPARGEQPLSSMGREIVISDIGIDERPPLLTVSLPRPVPRTAAR
jgi:glucosyl-3-phosphoglycerate synthase